MQLSYFYQKFKTLLIALITLLLCIIMVISISIFLLDYQKPAGLPSVDYKGSLVLNDVNIVNVNDGQIIKNQQLVIKDGLIVDIKQAGSKVTNAAKVIDGAGMYVSPGLFDMHVHVYDRKHLTLNLAYGVTSVRNMNGKKMHLRWRDELDDEQWLGSNLHVSSPILAGKGTHALNQEVLSVEQARVEVQQANMHGYDFIKVYGYHSAEIFEGIIDEANKIGIAVAKHGPHPAKGSNWSYIKGLQSLEHVEDIFQGPLNYQFDQETMQAVAINIKQSGVPVVPTLETFDHLTQLSNGKQTFIDSLAIEYLNPLYFDIESHFTVSRWLQDNPQQSQYHLEKQQILFKIVKALSDQQVRLLVGSDAGTMYTVPGIATHNEMNLMQRAGLSNEEVLRAATINAAQALNIDKAYGSINVGKVADLVLVEQNPLNRIEVLRTPNAVVKHGQFLDKEQLEQLKREAKNTESYYWSVIGLLEDLLTRFLFH